MTIRAALIITAKTGRLTLTSASFIARPPARSRAPDHLRPRHPAGPSPRRRAACTRPSRRRTLGLAGLEHADAHARRQLVQLARRKHFIPVQSARHFPQVLLADAERHALLRDLPVRDDVHRVDPREHRYRGVGDRHHVVVTMREDHALGEEAGLQQVLAVVDDRLDDEGAHGLVERRADVRDRALEHAIPERLDAELDGLAGLDHARMAFLHARPQLERVHLDDGRHHRALGNELPHLHGPFGDHPGNGGPDHGVAELLDGQVVGGSPILQQRLRSRGRRRAPTAAPSRPP